MATTGQANTISAAFPFRKQRRRVFTAEEMAEYRQPFAEPADVAAYTEWLATSDVPRLFIKAEPGALLGGGVNLDAARSWPAQTEVTVARVHFVQEDSPHEIGRAIAGWMGALG